jgi:uncharacterized protein
MQDARPAAPLDTAVAEVRAWVDRAVIGLNLCPFAKAVQVKRLVRYVGTDATDTEALRDALVAELVRLRDTDITTLETTLLVHPRVLQDFLDYNDFLDEADAVVTAMGLEGVIQVASFHPDYRFAGTAPDDMGNATNRAPHPTLHLLREASIDRAVAAFPEADAIFETNIATMESLGPEGWAALRRQCREEAGRGRADDGVDD